MLVVLTGTVLVVTATTTLVVVLAGVEAGAEDTVEAAEVAGAALDPGRVMVTFADRQ